jgi:hypothetical protein
MGKEQRWFELSGGGRAFLTHRRESRIRGWLRSVLGSKTSTVPELQQAATIFRLERYGLKPPKLLAVGRRLEKGWRSSSFLLTQPLQGHFELIDWLAQAKSHSTERWHILRSVARMLRRIHQAGYALDSLVNPRCLFGVQTNAGPERRIVLASAEGLQRVRNFRGRRSVRDLRRICSCLSQICSRTDILRFILAYGDRRKLDVETRRLLRSGIPRLVPRT